MARIVYQNQEYRMPDREIEGTELMKEFQVPPDHDLVLMRPEGNVLVNRRRKVHPMDGDYFVDAPTFEYGSEPPGQ